MHDVSYYGTRRKFELVAVRLRVTFDLQRIECAFRTTSSDFLRCDI